MLEIYHNKGYFNENMHRILLEKDNPYQFFLQIGKDYIKNNYPMHHYQIEDVYNYLFPHLTKKEQYLILIDYLRRSKIKPKIFFQNNISKQERSNIIEQLSNLYHLDTNILYKHSTLIKHQNEYTLALYQNNQSTLYNIKVDI